MQKKDVEALSVRELVSIPHMHAQGRIKDIAWEPRPEGPMQGKFPLLLIEGQHDEDFWVTYRLVEPA